jgi:hypothetical protein
LLEKPRAAKRSMSFLQARKAVALYSPAGDAQKSADVTRCARASHHPANDSVVNVQ